MLTSIERLLLVRGIPMFRELRDDFLVRLAAAMGEVSFEAGKVIFHAGQEGKSLYVLVKGKVRVYLEERELAVLSDGDCFGEMSVFDSAPRSASVLALTPCECLVLTQQQLYEALEETPEIAFNIIKMLSARIRQQNYQIHQFLAGALHPSAMAPLPPQF